MNQTAALESALDNNPALKNKLSNKIGQEVQEHVAENFWQNLVKQSRERSAFMGLTA
jgi:hypothetical protein